MSRTQTNPSAAITAARTLADAGTRRQHRSARLGAWISAPIFLASCAVLAATGVRHGHATVMAAATVGAVAGPVMLWVSLLALRTAARAIRLTDGEPTLYSATGRRVNRGEDTVSLVLLSARDAGAVVAALIIKDLSWSGLEGSPVYCWGTPRGRQTVAIASLDLDRGYGGRLLRRVPNRYSNL